MIRTISVGKLLFNIRGNVINEGRICANIHGLSTRKIRNVHRGVYQERHISNKTVHSFTSKDKKKSQNLFHKVKVGNYNGNKLKIISSQNQEVRFHAVWMRYNCQCPKCCQVDSGQRINNVYKFLPNYTIKEVFVEDDIVKVQWNEDDHLGIFPGEFLEANSYEEAAREKIREEIKPVFLSNGTLPQVKYEDVMSSDETLLQWVKYLNEVGICLVKGLPSSEDSLKKVVERLWPIQSTIYGDIFDVIALPLEESINIAYSNIELNLHMDLPYYMSPPGLQFLHCYKLDSCVTGGENQFLDIFQVVEEFRDLYPNDFKTLTRVPATFKKIHFNREVPVSMTLHKPHICVNNSGDVTEVRWSPHFEGPLRVAPEDVEPYYKAYNRLATMMDNSEHNITYRMKEGEMVSFNNCRIILHGRSGFELNGGTRHLRGCYVNIDEFKSRFEVLSKLYGDGSVSKRVGNNDW